MKNSKPLAIISDLDGTIVKANPLRDPYDLTQVMTDEPIMRIIHLMYGLRDLYMGNAEFLFVTARGTRGQDETQDGLTEHVGEPYKLFMRDERDDSEDHLMKADTYVRKIQDFYDVHYVFEDNLECVAMWRSFGLTTLAVSELCLG